MVLTGSVRVAARLHFVMLHRLPHGFNIGQLRAIRKKIEQANVRGV